jgi:hypothetical protein
MDAATLDEKYAELTNENLIELHELIRPFFLRYAYYKLLVSSILMDEQKNQGAGSEVPAANGAGNSTCHHERSSKKTLQIDFSKKP